MRIKYGKSGRKTAVVVESIEMDPEIETVG
jgi:hypothetical protein